MDLQISEVSGVTKAALAGRLDTAAVNGLESRFAASLVPVGKSAIVDLSNVTFIASLGIRMLLSVARGLGGRGARFALYGANPAVLEIIETTAISDIIPVVASETEAVAAVA